jgi:hypothetical protein
MSAAILASVQALTRVDSSLTVDGTTMEVIEAYKDAVS